jgi:hypothetical protein
LSSFDVPDGFSSTPDRDITTTPTQALLMINSPWVLARAEAWADRLWQDHRGRLSDAVIAAYRSALGYEPDSVALEEAMAFLEDQAAQFAGGDDLEAATRGALADFCHVLLNSSEFMYVD